jgi:aspartate aminotransferase
MVRELNKIQGISCFQPGGAFYVFPNVSGLLRQKTPEGKILSTDDEVAQYFLEKCHLVTVPGSAFGLSPYLRMSYAVSLETLEEAISRICDGVNLLS